MSLLRALALGEFAVIAVDPLGLLAHRCNRAANLALGGVEYNHILLLAQRASVDHGVGVVHIAYILPLAGSAECGGCVAQGDKTLHIVEHRVGVVLLLGNIRELGCGVNGQEELGVILHSRKSCVDCGVPLHRCTTRGAIARREATLLGSNKLQATHTNLLAVVDNRRSGQREEESDGNLLLLGCRTIKTCQAPDVVAAGGQRCVTANFAEGVVNLGVGLHRVAHLTFALGREVDGRWIRLVIGLAD